MLRGLQCVSQERGDRRGSGRCGEPRLFSQHLIPAGIKDRGLEGQGCEQKFRERVFPVFPEGSTTYYSVIKSPNPELG